MLATACGDDPPGALDAGEAHVAVAATTSTRTFHPVADARVESAHPSTSYGGLTRLSSSTSPQVISYVRFALTGISGTVTSARLRFYVNTGTADGPAVHPAGTAWSESITWSTQPGPTGAAVADAGAQVSGTWMELDVTPLVVGDGAVGFALIGGASDGFLFSSREASRWPELVVTTTVATCGDAVCAAGESCTSCPADCGGCATGPVVLEADAFVESGRPATAFGSQPTLIADTSPLAESYLRFRVSGVSGSVTRARLRLTVTNPTGDAPAVYLASNAWSEASVTWNSRPPRSGGAIADLGAVSVGAVAEYDVTAAVAGDGVYTFALIPQSTDGMDVHAREGAVRPELVLTIGAPVGPAATLEADAYVDAGRATTAFGTATTLISDGSPLAESYLRFRVSGLAAPPTGARLRLAVTNGTDDAPALYAAASGWTEAAVTWNTRPARIGGVVADLGAVSVGAVVEYDVTAQVTGDGIYTFALVPETGDGFAAHAREGSIRPELVLTTGAPTGGGFRFTAVGDHGSNSNAAAVLSLAPGNGDFLLSLGDLSYGTKPTELAWCDFVKSRLGNHPVEIISGNHESMASVGHGLIDRFIAADCLPNRLPGVVGDYAKQFYVDLPAGAPIARLIAISPGIEFDNGGSFYYTAGSSRYQWLAATIDAARAAGLRWVIVANHRNCITIGVKACEIGADVMNLLIAKRVDLVLQGHDHTYQRTKQLAHRSGCASVVPGGFDADCVVDGGQTYARGAGTIFLINGLGGNNTYELDTNDPEVSYFQAWTASAYGVSRITVTPARLEVDFVRALGSAFSDSFAIFDP